MKVREIITALLVFSVIAGVFFYKFFLFGRIPFPGDLLIAEYKPWRTYSYLGYNPGSYPQKAQYFDTIRQLYPWKTLSIDQLKNTAFPLWNPHNFAGSPLLANSQSAVLYPLNILYVMGDQEIIWAILMFLQPLIASTGMYFFCRKINISYRGAVLSGITYAYSMFMITFLEYNSITHVAAWLPFMLFALEQIARKWSVVSVLIFAASTTSAALAGHLQMFVYVMIYSAAYLFFRLTSFLRRISWQIIFVFLLPLGISAAQLFPSFELIRFAARAPQEYSFLIEKLLLQPYQLALFLSADLFGNPATHNYRIQDAYPGNAIYVGIVPMLFALWGLRNWKVNRLIRFFGITALVVLLFITRSPLSQFLYRITLPIVSTVSPTNAIFILSFCISVLAGFGVEHWFTPTKKNGVKIVIAAAGAYLLLWIGNWIDPEIISGKNLLLSTCIFIVAGVLFTFDKIMLKWKNIKKFQLMSLKKTAFALLLVLAVADSFYFFHKFNPFVPRQLVFPKAAVFTWLSNQSGVDRFWGIGSAAIEANFATQYKLYSPDGYDPLYPKTYGEFIGGASMGKLTRTFDNQTRSDARIAVNSSGLMDNPARKKALDTLGVKYILDRTENASTQKEFPPDEFKLVYESDGWKIFENIGSLPRAIMVNDYKIYNSATEFERLFFDTSFDPRKTVLLNQKPDIESNSSDLKYLRSEAQSTVVRGKPSEAIITSYQPNEVVVHTTAESDQLLVLSDNFFPGWKATIDSQASEILKANWTFRAVMVPKGVHTVTFRYEPLSFAMGVKTSIISVIGLTVACLSFRKKKRL